MPSDHQDDALKQAGDILRQHFPAFIILAQVGDEESGSTDTAIHYDGGFHTALGLVTDAQHELLHGEVEDTDEEETD